MAIEIGKITANNNGRDGVRLPDNVDFKATEIIANGNLGDGVNIVKTDSVLGQLGIPEDIDIQDFISLLEEIGPLGDTEKEAVIKESTLLQSLLTGAYDLVAVTANILAIATNDKFAEIVSVLRECVE
ncbi:hypothetical protein [Vibrio fluvialis]|uniref:hypothetical protein n=1 Tax=Vibrio fluvialis TaxID=676 RepID=UPI0006E12E09|nr:hypothetical protein [Vibrio fluvialis]KQH89395.1 hypothetical protein AMR75_12990 [Vibrio fluvialis]